MFKISSKNSKRLWRNRVYKIWLKKKERKKKKKSEKYNSLPLSGRLITRHIFV